MSDNGKRDKIKRFVEGTVMSWVNDAKTHLWAKCEKGRDFNGSGLGGGNFTIAAAAFISLNFIAKVYNLLTDKACKVPDYDRDDFKDERSRLSKCSCYPTLSKIAVFLRPPLKGQYDVVETTSFKKLVSDLGEDVPDCLSTCKVFSTENAPAETRRLTGVEAQNIWGAYRNSLFHKATPGCAIFSSEFSNPCSFDEQLAKFKRCTEPPFLLNRIKDPEASIPSPYVDLLCYRDVPRLAAWISSVVNDSQDNKIDQVLDFLGI